METGTNDSQAASENLTLPLEPDPSERPRPLKYHERTKMTIKAEENILQLKLVRIKDFILQNKLEISSKKWYFMLFTRSRTCEFPSEISIGDIHVLQVKKTLRILGVQVQDELGWQAQTDEMVRKAINTIWILRRMKSLGVDQKTLVEYWKSEGRVHLEMACSVWHSGLTIAPSPSPSPSPRPKEWPWPL